eukprot:1194833-Prorocentrum_minimum.AAC.1
MSSRAERWQTYHRQLFSENLFHLERHLDLNLNHAWSLLPNEGESAPACACRRSAASTRDTSLSAEAQCAQTWRPGSGRGSEKSEETLQSESGPGFCSLLIGTGSRSTPVWGEYFGTASNLRRRLGRDWCPQRVCSLSPSELVPATGVFSLPFREWCPLRVCSLSPSASGARYGYVLSPLPRLVSARCLRDALRIRYVRQACLGLGIGPEHFRVSIASVTR